MNLTEVLALTTLVVGVPLNVYVVWKLQRLARAADIPVLSERALTAVVVLLVVAVFAALFVNNDQPIPPFDVYTTKVSSRIVILILAFVPALRWLWLYRRQVATVIYEASAVELQAVEVLKSKGWSVSAPSGAVA